MNTHVEKISESTSHVASGSPQLRGKSKQAFRLTDNRPEAVVQRKLHSILNNNGNDQGTNNASVSPEVVQRIKIDLETVSPAVLAAFNKSHAFIKVMFHLAGEFPQFFAMTDIEKIQYFKILNRSMPFLDTIIKRQQDLHVDGAHPGPLLNAPRNLGERRVIFLVLNPDFIYQSFLLLKGEKAALRFFNPTGIIYFKVNNIQELAHLTHPPAPSSEHIGVQHPKKGVPEGKEEKKGDRLFDKKQQYTDPDGAARERNAARDAKEEEKVRLVLMESLRARVPIKLLKSLDFHQLELLHAKMTYATGNLSTLKSMKKIPLPGPETGITHLDALRKSLVTDPAIEEGAYEIREKALLEKKLLEDIMPKLVLLSHKIRLANYYDADSEEAILDSGRLQSKERRIRKAGGSDVPNKSGKLDDQLRNTDHVFFFAEYEEGHGHRAPFRKSRFGGAASEGDATLTKKLELNGLREGFLFR
jgi:hypothetical protein